VSLGGWDEFVLVVARDRADNVVIVCSIENLDPMGVHTGDSVTVAPQMTLCDEDYQELRDAAIAIVRAVGVETGGANVQFARARDSGELRVIEMNPRVSRSSALASKATGYPIAKVAARLAVGYRLDEIRNDLTGTTPASFEPTLDYVVVKFPRFAFEKFPGVDRTLGTQMKSVGEAMGIGRTFPEAFAKARRGLEVDPDWRPEGLHPFFRAELALPAPAGALAFRRVDSCAGEVEAASNYFYSTRGERDESPPQPGRSVVILGAGPNRIGQGIEFDYCCVKAAESFRAQGYEAVIVNCNPETVSTDYDASDRLYFEPLDEEAVLAVLEREAPVGVCIQFGGQTPLRLAPAIEQAGYRILGTPRGAIDLAEDRERFALLAAALGLRCPEWGIAVGASEAVEVAARIGFPVLVRPSYVLGGARMRVCYGDGEVADAMERLEGPVLVDRFLEGAVELDVDALCDGSDTHICAVMEHVEEAGIHSGDSSCVLPAPSDSPELRALVRALGPALGVVGLLNVQLALLAGDAYVLEVNPRASRTVPFASKATGVNLVDAACRLAAGAALRELGLPPEGSAVPGSHVKSAVFPFVRFPGADAVLGPEMRSTGEVMASGSDFATAFARAERAAGRALPRSGRAFISVCDGDKVAVVGLARGLAALGFELVATAGTASALELAGIPVGRVEKGAPVVELIASGGAALIVNTPQGRNARRDGYAIREAALLARVPCITTLAGARAALAAIRGGRAEPALSLQERHAAARGPEVLRAAS
jgi:carbamoyl-phosphate synthase large subunit